MLENVYIVTSNGEDNYFEEVFTDFEAVKRFCSNSDKIIDVLEYEVTDNKLILVATYFWRYGKWV